ncbi:S1 family peptidase [Paenibacillus bouchesdurhonensis]|uniref:S1 family peptidase n=1 Tax=Paenibacillus bouchesdurhonensis TaxID=1870990 RepID=UPI001F3503CB|nr:S1 family peptidase [Paenibacillus bouchesdurhonensis]
MILLASFRKAYQVKQRLSAQLLKRRGIHGIGIGLCDPNRPKKGAAIILYASALAATAKSSKRSAKRKPLHPVRLQRKTGVPIRIVRSTSFHKHGSPSIPHSHRFRTRIRPVIAGYSIGTPLASGTAGLIVARGNCGKSRYILSNNHVLVNENTRRCSLTLQPGGADGGTVSKDRVGQVHRFVRLSKQRNNYMDAAMAKPLRRSLLSTRYAVFGAVPGHLRSYRIGDRLKKVGRTTGVTTGRVESIHTDIRVGYGSYGNLGTISFKNQSVIRGKRPVSLAGDSGSVWLTRKGNRAAAVNFAGSADGFLSISYPIEWFMQVFGTRVPISPHHRKQRRLLPPRRGVKRSYLFTKPLPPKLLRTIRPIRANRCPNDI